MAEATLVPRIYSNFRGVDFRGEEINLTRSPDSLNVWKDYKETERIRTRPGMKLCKSFDGRINCVYSFKDFLVIHSGTNLYKVKNGEVIEDIDPYMKDKPSEGFIFDGCLYIKDGSNYYEYGADGGLTSVELNGYKPTTSIGRKPLGGGTIHEDVNLLSRYRRNSFVGDGVSTEYHLDTTDIDDVPPRITVDGGWQIKYNDPNISVNYADGIITFKNAPPKPLTDGQDNVVIEFRKRVPGYKERILNCTLLQVFDNRVFFGGNPDYPNILWHSSLNNPAYCSDLDYYEEGHDSALIRGIVAGNNALWVFREPSQENTTVFYHTPTIDYDYGKIYPSQHSSITTGCVGKAINFNDDIVFFST
jgi:hypothetical protein